MVKSAGGVAGTEVRSSTPRSARRGAHTHAQIPQLYIHHPAAANEPPSILKDLSDVTLEPGASATVAIQLSRFDLSIWSAAGQSWVRPGADSTWGVSVGASSRKSVRNKAARTWMPRVQTRRRARLQDGFINRINTKLTMAGTKRREW